MPDNAAALAANYGALDRLLHRIAFAHPLLQRVLGDLESDLFKRSLTNVEVTHPVFITGLPRAGTTLLLDLLYDTGEFASFTYRQMPFVLNPLLWHRLSARAQQPATEQERAHGDQMSVSFDSPEAFEEVLWLNHLERQLFDGNTIRPLTSTDIDADFHEAFRSLARKLICLANARAGVSATPRPLRYLSKNNANLARLGAIASMFDDAALLVCFRHPAAHVASLHRQHLQFLKTHADDRFARRYMAWIGHYDFGANFRPIRFAKNIDASPREEAFWLAYWIDAYRYVLENSPPQVRLVGFDLLLDDAQPMLRRLANTLTLSTDDALDSAAERLRSPGSKPAALDGISPRLAEEAEQLYAELVDRAL